MGNEAMSPGAATLDEALVRYRRPLCVDADVHEQLRRSGFALLPEPVLPSTSVRGLRDLTAEFLGRLDEPVDGSFLTTGRIADSALRSEVTTRAGDLVLPHLRRHFVADARIDGTALQIKPSSPASQLDPHQDSSLVDERHWPGVYVWIAVDDTGPGNGGLHVLPGSHRYGNLQRTLNIPWQLEPYVEAMARESVALTVPSGSAVLFDAATVHWSPPNHGDRVRVACNSFVAHADAPMMHYFADERTTPGTVEAYEIDVSFFLDADIMQRPPARFPFLGEWPQHRIDWSAAEFEDVCRLAKSEAGW